MIKFHFVKISHTFYLHVTYIKYESVKSIIIIIKNMIISYTFEQILFS